MGFDISNHPVDVNMIQEHIIPYIMGKGSIDDLAERAAAGVMTRYRANTWGLALSALSSDLTLWQLQETDFASEDGQLDKADLEGHAELYGFNTSLHVWGRPFFNTGQGIDETLEIYDSYQSLAGQPLSKVDELVLAMIDKLNRQRDHNKSNLKGDTLLKVNSCYPIEDHIERDDEGFEYNQQEASAIYRDPIEILRGAYQNRKQKSVLVHIDGEEQSVEPEEVLAHAPFEILNFASNILPGWMGRGHVWPTALFEEIGVNVSHIFETPASLLAPLVKEFPSIEEDLSATIIDNYSLGGFVPAEKVSLLVDVLEKNREDLIFAYEELSTREKFKDNIPLDLSEHYWKIYEPAVYALRNGYGFIEATEIYSAFEGKMN